VSGGRPGPRLPWRSESASRLEAFSDAVFAFAVTLLVVSLEVPTSYDELMRTMLGFPAFAICFTILIMIWHAHVRFFRTYPLDDATTTVLNVVLLFVVLFYIYPLKFLFAYLVATLFRLGVEAPSIPGAREAKNIMIVYGIGFTAVFGVFALLHAHALRRRDRLGLDPAAVYETVSRLQHYVLYIAVALLSISIALVLGGEGSFWSGMAYGLLGPLAAIHGAWRRRVRERRFGAKKVG
jgi:transmembrane protein TMEM174 (potassium channel)